uniref:PLA2c domain-containing protein n=1 Tax=Oreochromis aureus TaxID=47969 RepID=A0AAZ1XZC4_OREAU
NADNKLRCERVINCCIQKLQCSYQIISLLHIFIQASVPHIALLASGGGQRAAVGLVGFLHQMEKEGLLDTLLYLGGVSGSTWSMASLYNDPQFSTNMDAAVSRLLDSPSVKLEQAVDWLGERAKEEHFSLADIWGVLTSAGIMKQMDLRCLSDEANRNATNPYPIYCATEKHCFTHGPIEGKWFEISPHEAGFTELGLFIETSLLGSKFQNGTLLEKKKEMDMVKLQGDFQNTRSVYSMADKHTGLSVLERKRPFLLYSIHVNVFLPVSFLIKEVIPLIAEWKWGTTGNFLYQYQGESYNSSNNYDPFPLNESFLIDAGLVINVPYPSFLGDKRDIDLIIAPEYSAGNMFEMEKPFPEINDTILEDRDWPKDCYVLEGKEKEPTIIYMPLFNRRNCKGLFPNAQLCFHCS